MEEMNDSFEYDEEDVLFDGVSDSSDDECHCGECIKCFENLYYPVADEEDAVRHATLEVIAETCLKNGKNPEWEMKALRKMVRIESSDPDLRKEAKKHISRIVDLKARVIQEVFRKTIRSLIFYRPVPMNENVLEFIEEMIDLIFSRLRLIIPDKDNNPFYNAFDFNFYTKLHKDFLKEYFVYKRWKFIENECIQLRKFIEENRPEEGSQELEKYKSKTYSINFQTHSLQLEVYMETRTYSKAKELLPKFTEYISLKRRYGYLYSRRGEIDVDLVGIFYHFGMIAFHFDEIVDCENYFLESMLHSPYEDGEKHPTDTFRYKSLFSFFVLHFINHFLRNSSVSEELGKKYFTFPNYKLANKCGQKILDVTERIYHLLVKKNEDKVYEVLLENRAVLGKFVSPCILRYFEVLAYSDRNDHLERSEFLRDLYFGEDESIEILNFLLLGENRMRVPKVLLS